MTTKLTIKRQLARALAASGDNKFDEALAICDELLARNPALPSALALKGTILGASGHPENAITFLENAIVGDATVADWHANLSAAYSSVYRCADAVRSARSALRLSPNNPGYLVGLAHRLLEVDDHDHAIAYLLRAIGLAPNDPVAHLSLAQILLAQGEMDAGWIEYEWRNQLDSARHTLPRMTSALWNGMRVPGRLFVIGDQGYGDTIQFSRYIPLAAERCDELLVGASPELAPLLSSIPGVSSCLIHWEKVPGHTAHIRISSLAHLLGRRSDKCVLGPDAYLKAPANRIQDWKRRLQELLQELRPGARVGFAWRGSPKHPNDRRRSVDLAAFASFMQEPGIQWVSLQKPITGVEAAELARRGVLNLSEALTDFAETAAIIANLDLVITIDTAVAHLAGALGCPVWVMLPKPAEWRWMLEGTNSPWYSSMRLFRQDIPGGWDKVIVEVGRVLRDLPSQPRRRADL